jgi:D-proline reductase (dithiol) PrdB
VSLVARHLEENGMPTVIVGSALDIVEYCGVPRFVFTDLPLGNPCGPPYQRDIQRAVVRQAVGLLETTDGPRVTVRAAVEFDDPDWRPRYGRVDPKEIERLRALGDERRKRQVSAKEG